MFRVAAPDGSFVVRELHHDTERQRVADVIGDAFEYDAWFKKDGGPAGSREERTRWRSMIVLIMSSISILLNLLLIIIITRALRDGVSRTRALSARPFR